MKTDFETLQLERRGAVAGVWLNRPEAQRDERRDERRAAGAFKALARTFSARRGAGGRAAVLPGADRPDGAGGAAAPVNWR
jgi:hypothetical protein